MLQKIIFQIMFFLLKNPGGKSTQLW